MEILKGFIAPDEGLREALEIVTSTLKEVNSGVLEVKSGDVQGKIGIAWGRFITGAIIVDGENGKKALRTLLQVRQGKFSFLDTQGAPVPELRQSLGIDLNGVVPYVPDEIKPSVTPWLFEPEEQVEALNLKRAPAKPEPVSSPEPSPEPSMETLSAAAPETPSESTFATTSESTPQTASEPLPETTAEPAAEPLPETTAEPAAEPLPETTAEPAAEPAPQTTAEPADQTAPQPDIAANEVFELNSDVLKQARKEAATYLAQETRNATHLKIDARRAREAFEAELRRQLPPPEQILFDNRPTLEGRLESADDEWQTSQPVQPPAVATPDVETIEPVSAEMSEQPSGLAALLEDGDDDADDFDMPAGVSQAQAATTESPGPPLDQSPVRPQIPPPPAVPEHLQPFPPTPISNKPIPMAPLVEPVGALPEPPTRKPAASAAAARDKSGIADLFDPGAAPDSIFSRDAARVPSQLQAAVLATANATPSGQRMLPPGALPADLPAGTQTAYASRRAAAPAGDSVGIGILCVLFFVVSCAGTVLFGPKVLALVTSTLHITH
jgi:hypothetical protein